MQLRVGWRRCQPCWGSCVAVCRRGRHQLLRPSLSCIGASSGWERDKLPVALKFLKLCCCWCSDCCWADQPHGAGEAAGSCQTRHLLPGKLNTCCPVLKMYDLTENVVNSHVGLRVLLAGTGSTPAGGHAAAATRGSILPRHPHMLGGGGGGHCCCGCGGGARLLVG
jgi:hypothetical protein